MKNRAIKSLTLAMFLAIGLVLPLLTGQIQQIDNMILPMHIPVFLCALICGWRCGLPILRSFALGMPQCIPTPSAWRLNRQLSFRAHRLGRVQATLLGLGGKAFAFQAFIGGALLNAIPGIILQLILIPAVMVALGRAKLVLFRRTQKRQSELAANGYAR